MLVIQAGLASSGSASTITIWTALISAGSGVLGVLVGGLITRRVALDTEDKRAASTVALDQQRADREAEGEARLTRGVARLTQARFRQLATHLRQAANEGVWPPDVPLAEPPLPLDDRKLLAGVLTDAELTAVFIAEHSMRSIAAMRDVVAAGADSPIRPLDSGWRPTIREAEAHLTEAAAALERVATLDQSNSA